MIKGIGKRVFILGMAGISMSGIAKILAQAGHQVVGCDRTPTAVFEELESLSVCCFKDDGKPGLDLNYDTLIFTSAMPKTDKRIKMAVENGIVVLSRPEALNIIMKDYEQVVAVSGSHGKTTTTGLISSIMLKGSENITAHIGGVLARENSSLVIKGKGGWFITEACEYNRSFLDMSPTVGVILNMDLDHIDTYFSKESIVDAFLEFSNRICDNGKLIINIDDENAFDLISRTKKNKDIVTVSIKNPLANYYIENKIEKKGEMTFELLHDGVFVDVFKFSRTGEHNLYNVLFAVVTALECEVPLNLIKNEISFFEGVKRRYQKIGKINEAPVILDYAHHPAEIEKIILEAKREASGKVFAVFQPHTYSRTKYFWTEFIKTLMGADNIIMYPIYPAREKQIIGVSSRRMAEDIRKLGGQCYYARTLDEVETYLEYFVKQEDIILILGAGDIGNFSVSSAD